METLLEAIRQALGDDATPEQRAAAAQICRAVLARLEPAPSAPTVAAPALPMLADPVGQVLDVLIAKVKGAAARGGPTVAPPPAPMPPVAHGRVPFVPVRGRRRRR